MNPIVFNPTLEWDSLPDATYSGFGSHNCDCFTSTGSFGSTPSSYVVYPNPANQGDNIGINTSKEIKNIYLYNLEGKQLNFISVNATKAVLNTSDLISGNYLLKITFDSGLSIEHNIIVQ
jgi:hypothetical protein